MDKIIGWWVYLQGKRTYIVALILAIFNLAVAVGWLQPEAATQINAILVALGFGALRAGIANK